MVRTIFLLRYLSSVELRHTIQAATNKSEAFNRFVQWVCFGGGGVIAENVRDEQRKLPKRLICSVWYGLSVAQASVSAG